MRFCYCLILLPIFYFGNTSSLYANVNGSIEFTVSMEKPHTHYFHITMKCSGVEGEYTDFKLPVWTPGYYWLVNYSKNLINFQAVDGDSKPLDWTKVTKSSWRVNSTSKTILVSYDVYAFNQSVAEPFLDDNHAYIAPAGLLMYVDGQLKHDATVTLNPQARWKSVSTGLDPVNGKINTFFAPDFDTLYDSPILLGNQEVLSFEAKGIKHYVALAEPEKFDKQKFINDLKKMVEVASSVVGEMPYKHYTFIIMGNGRGGLEHLNSTAVFSSGTAYNNGDQEGYKRWMNFLTHEYFHLYNIKAIRPIALGPFDYDRENYTNMLWVSEGFTVYYEYLILNRAGLLTKDEVLTFIADNLESYENGTGKLYQSATQSSFDTWLNFFNHNEHTANTTISYYDKGAVLGMLLDLTIRKETQNKKSLDDVMKSLYVTFFKEKKRGFTDDEFKQTCELVAGVKLTDLFEIASTTKPVNYETYLNCAGLSLKGEGDDTEFYFGATVRDEGGALLINSVELNSPASISGLSAKDELVSVNGEPVTDERFAEILKAKSSKVIQIEYKRNGVSSKTNVELTFSSNKRFSIRKQDKPSVQQSTTLLQWLKD